MTIIGGGRCPFRDDEDEVCNRPLLDADVEAPVGVWHCELGHAVMEVAGTDTRERGPYAKQRPADDGEQADG